MHSDLRVFYWKSDSEVDFIYFVTHSGLHILGTDIALKQ